jgi:hypothetical protein
MVFVTSTNPSAPIRVNVSEIAAPGAPNLLPGGLQGSALLNADPLNPANPAIANADIANPAIANPAIANPAIANPAIANTAITDSNWAITNKGNTTGTYSIHAISKVVLPRRVIPQLIVNRTYTTPVAVGCNLVEQPQTVVVSNISNPKIIMQQQLSHSATGQMIAGALRGRRNRGGLRPTDAAPPDSTTTTDITDNSLDDATVAVGPGETVYVTLRFFNTDATQPLGFDPGADITIVILSHARDTGDTENTVAASHLIAASGSLPATVVGATYDAFLLAAGGTPPFVYTLVSGSLPPGLTLSGNGEITGHVGGAGGTYTFGVQVSDSSNPAQAPVQETLQIIVSNVALAIANVVAQGPNGSATAKTGDTITVTVTVTNAGGAANGVAPSISVVPSGSATASCGSSNPLSANMDTGANQVFTFSCGDIAGTGSLSFSVSLLATDPALSASLSVSSATSNPVTLLGVPPTVKAVASSGGQPYSPGTWTNQPVTIVFTCTTASGTPSTKQVTVSSPGQNQTITTTCTDAAGNSVDVSFGGINIDLTPPLITWTATVNGQPYNGEPTNQQVVVTFTCTDAGGSGVASFTGPVTIGPAAAGQSVTGTCTDGAGNTDTVTTGAFKSNTPPPTLTASYGGYTPGAWTNQPVTVTFNCVAAAGLSVQSATSASTVSVQGAGQFVAGQCTDTAGNSSQINAGPINIETGLPTITLLSIPNPTAGWYRSSVPISWLCTDPLAGQTTISRTVSTEGANQTVTVNCTNLAGASVSASQTVSVDLTPPVINGSVSPAPGSSGWNTSPVSVTFTCQDALSGVAPGYPQGNTTITADTNGSTISGTCRDVAGNTSSANLGPVMIDRTAPTIQLQSISPVNADGWSNSAVTVTWVCIDSGSGPVSPTVSTVVTGDGSNRSGSGTCHDVAGNSASATQSGIKIDTVAPQVSFTSPQNGANYALGQQVVVSFNCFDTSGSGVASCSGSGGANTEVIVMNTPGPGSFTVTGVDRAGNTTVVTHNYTVGN